MVSPWDPAHGPAYEDQQPDPPSIAETLRHHGITPCSKCHGEGIVRPGTPALEAAIGCDRCDGSGEEPKCPTCGGTGTVERECPDGWVPFPCDCTMEGVAPDVGNNISMGRANPGIADMKGQSE